MKKLVIALFAILIFSGVAAAQERPQCFDSNGNWIYTGQGICFVGLAGDIQGLAGFTEDGRLEATWTSKRDWAKFFSDDMSWHLSDKDVNLTFIPPSACSEISPGVWSCDPAKFYRGEGKISLNGPLFYAPPCPTQLNIMGNVQSPSGDWFRAQYFLLLTKSETEGCKLGFEKLTVTPK